jgi:hypothetical protein
MSAYTCHHQTRLVRIMPLIKSEISPAWQHAQCSFPCYFFIHHQNNFPSKEIHIPYLLQVFQKQRRLFPETVSNLKEIKMNEK